MHITTSAFYRGNLYRDYIDELEMFCVRQKLFDKPVQFCHFILAPLFQPASNAGSVVSDPMLTLLAS